MNTVSVVGSVSRRAGGLFESVRRLHQELFGDFKSLSGGSSRQKIPLVDGEEGKCDGWAPNASVTVLGLRDDFTEIDLGAWAPVPVATFEVRGPRALGYAPDLGKKLNSLNPQVAHIHGLWQYPSLAVLNWHRQSRRPYLVSPHGMLDPWALENSNWKKRLAWLAYERSHLQAAACLRALCQSEAESIRKLGLKNPICIIPNGVDLPGDGLHASNHEIRESRRRAQSATVERHSVAALAASPASPAFHSDRKVLLFLGRIHPKKGLSNLLKAWANVQPPREWVLAIAGWDQDGHEANLKRLACELGIVWTDQAAASNSEASLVFLGAQFGAYKRVWLERCTAFILPSFSEGLPMAVLEAWAHAKPVLITPQCNFPEAFITSAAIAIKPQPVAIAAGLEELFRTSSSTLELFGSCGYELVANHFSWPKIVHELKSVYLWLVGGGSRPACVLTC